MAVPVTIPRLGLDEGQGHIAEWYQLDGANVNAGDLIYRIDTDFASIDIEADEGGVFRHAPGATDSPPAGEIVAYLLAADEPLPGETAQPARKAATPRASKSRGRGKVYPLKDVLEAAAVPDAEPAAELPEGLPWDPFPAAETSQEEVFEAPKPLLLFPRIVNEIRQEAAIEDELDETPAPADIEEEAEPPEAAGERGGWELVPGENDFNPDWLLERNDTKEANEPAKGARDRFQASSIRSLALGRDRKAEEPEQESEEPREESEEPRSDSDEPVSEPVGKDAPETQVTAAPSESSLPEPPMPVAAVPEAMETPAPSVEPVPERRGEPVNGQPLFARITIDVTEAGKMRDQLTREWMGSNIRPTDEDIVLRAIARTLHEGAAFRRITDLVGIRPLNGTSRHVHLLADAATRPFRDAVSSLAALRATPGTDMQSICTLTDYGPFGLDDATPALVDGQPLAFAMGAVRFVPVFRGDRPLRASVLTLTLSYDSEAIPDGAAARLLSRICELVEAPYALLAH